MKTNQPESRFTRACAFKTTLSNGTSMELLSDCDLGGEGIKVFELYVDKAVAVLPALDDLKLLRDMADAMIKEFENP